MIEYFMIYMCVVNIIAFVTYAIDKQKAKHNKWRISENTLIGLALAGGFVGAYVGMKVFRHKTKHNKFTIGVPVIAIAWIAAMIYFFV